MQAFRGYGTAAKGAEVATDVLSTLMLAKGIGKLATKGIVKGVTSLVTQKTPGLSAATKSTIGSTGLDFKGFQAITQGKPYIPSNAPQVLGKGAYSAPQVGKSGGLLGGTGGAKYAGTQGSLGGTKTPGGVVQSVVPGGSPRMPFIEPQSKVPAKTFDKGAELARKLADPNYRSGSALANNLRQQATQAGFKSGQTSITHSELPKGASTTTQIGKAATVSGVLGALSQTQGSTSRSGSGSNQAKKVTKIIKSSYEPQGQVLSESRQRILREIKKPYVLPEISKQKLKNYKPNFAGKYTSQNTPDITASKKSDEMVKSQNSAGQAWRTKDKYWKGYETTERMNIVYDNLGHGSQYWDTIINENQRKTGTGWKDYGIQDHLNKIAHEKAMLKENPNFKSPFRVNIEEQETMQADKDPLFKRVSKRLKKEIDYPDKPAKNGYPNDSPPKMVNGWHPEYGKDKGYYNKLDPQSAEAMPLTGNPEIDKRVKKARKQPK